MKKINFIQIILGIFLFLFCHNVQLKAQVESQAAEEKNVRQILSEYFKALSNVDITKDRQTVLRFLHTISERTITQLSVQAGYRYYNENYNTFAEFLEQSIQEYDRDQIITTYELGQIYALNIIGDIAVVSFTAPYQDKKGTEVLSKGKHDNSFTLKKIDDNWKIIRADIIWVEEQVLKGQCYCWLYENKGESNSYVLRVSSPKGSDKKNDLLQLRVTSNPGKGEKIYYIEGDGKGYYKWLDSSSFELQKMDESGKVLKTIGKPQRHEDVISAILQYDIFDKNCMKMNIRK